jgi:hypothetical protein
MNNPIPLVVLVGHSRALIVSARHSGAWTVTVSEDPRMNVLPRRWLDMTGVKLRDTWRAALRAVIGTVVFRPGISQVRDQQDTTQVVRQKLIGCGVGTTGRDSVAVAICVRPG